MTNGQDVVVRGYIKPISTLRKPLESVDLETRESSTAAYERSDVAVVPAAGVIGEAMVALTLASAFLEKFGGDSLHETKRNFRGAFSLRCGITSQVFSAAPFHPPFDFPARFVYLALLCPNLTTSWELTTAPSRAA